MTKDLFDRRFVVFSDTGDFITYVLSKNGNISLTSDEYRRFWQTMVKAGMLFGTDVREYLEDVDKTAREFYVSAQGRQRAVEEGDMAAIQKDHDLISRLAVTLLQKRPEVFRPYLSLDSFRIG